MPRDTPDKGQTKVAPVTQLAEGSRPNGHSKLAPATPLTGGPRSPPWGRGMPDFCAERFGGLVRQAAIRSTPSPAGSGGREEPANPSSSLNPCFGFVDYQISPFPPFRFCSPTL